LDNPPAASVAITRWRWVSGGVASAAGAEVRAFELKRRVQPRASSLLGTGGDLGDPPRKPSRGRARSTRMIRSIWKRGLVLLVPIIAAASTGLIIASPTAAAMDYQASASQALSLVNQKRVNAGCGSLRVVRQLQMPAGQQSQDQAARDRLSHAGANGSTTSGRLHDSGYSRWAENIAQFQSAQAAVNFWSTSAAHRSSMLNCAFKDTGLAVARSNSGRFYWTQTFGG
jgi:uncharacterized protein YkwD